jgi:hypothetical protein
VGRICYWGDRMIENEYKASETGSLLTGEGSLSYSQNSFSSTMKMEVASFFRNVSFYQTTRHHIFDSTCLPSVFCFTLALIIICCGYRSVVAALIKTAQCEEL